MSDIEDDGFITCWPDTRGASARIPVLTLEEARAVRADATLHDDTTVAEACQIILRDSRDDKEREKASALLTLVEGETA